MSENTLRLVQSGDWRLDQPVHGLADIPKELRETLREAPFLAAEQVVETALAENANALLLTGELVDLTRTGPRAIVFLLDQFRRLGARNIPVFWATGHSDTVDRWPPAAALPDNVVVFPTTRVAQHEVIRDGSPSFLVQGRSRADQEDSDTSGFHRDAHGKLTIGVAHGTSDAPGKEGDRVHYMALGGRSRRATVDISPGVAHYAGAPQGRCPTDVGPSGCTVVLVDAEKKLKTRFVSTDVIRWVELSLEFTADTTADQLLSRLKSRLDKLQEQAGGMDQLVAWRLSGVGPLVARIRPGGLADELLAKLQSHGVGRRPNCYSYSLQCQDAFSAPHEWLDQETILGDLLRELQAFEEDSSVELDLAKLTPDGLDANPIDAAVLRELLSVTGPASRATLLKEATKLGVDLMTGPGSASQPVPARS